MGCVSAESLATSPDYLDRRLSRPVDHLGEITVPQYPTRRTASRVR